MKNYLVKEKESHCHEIAGNTRWLKKDGRQGDDEKYRFYDKLECHMRREGAQPFKAAPFLLFLCADPQMSFNEDGAGNKDR